MTLLFHTVDHWRRASDVCRWPMKPAVAFFAFAVILAATTELAGGEFPSDFLQGAGTNMQWSREITAPVVIETNTMTPRLVLDLNHVIIQPQVKIGRIHLGMSKEQVLRAWGSPSKAAEAGYPFGTDRVNVGLSYPTDRSSREIVHLIFDDKTDAVAAIWLTCFDWHEKGSLAPKAEECLRILGEPTLRNYIPEPLEPQKQPPKHWYCRMVYRERAMVLYFGDGRLMGLDVNPRAKGVAREGQGSDEYSIPFCLE